MRAALISLGSLSSTWTAAAMKKYFKQTDHLDLKNIEVRTNKTLEVLYNGKQLPKYDCIYAKGSFRYASVLRSIAMAFEKTAYMPIKPSTFETGHDKLLTHLVLQQNKIPMPHTYLSPSPEAANKILKTISYPIVIKLPQGTGGKGVMFADSYAAASSLMDTLVKLNQPFIIQEYIETGGVDTRGFVIGDKLVAAYKRKAVAGEKRANIHSGGKAEAYEPSNAVKKLAVETAKAVGAEICAVDILEGPKGPMVIEFNLSPGLQGVTKATKIDVADKIARYLYEQTKQRFATKKSREASQLIQDMGLGENILTTLDFRGERILLPEVVTKMTKFNEKDEVVIDASNKQVRIKKL